MSITSARNREASLHDAGGHGPRWKLRLRRHSVGVYTTRGGSFAIISDRARISADGRAMWFVYEDASKEPFVVGECLSHPTLRDAREALESYIIKHYPTRYLRDRV
jgi:hypothetical protein